MNLKSIVGAICTCLAVVSFSANSALVERLGGLAYYDDVADLTWLADADYAYTSGYHPDGRFSWGSANSWAAGLDVAGVTGWRLGVTLSSDPGCDNNSAGYATGYNCTGSEMGNLFYNVLGNTAGTLSYTGPFINIQPWYWTATEPDSPDGSASIFGMGTGFQWGADKDDHLSSWAVHDGDVNAVPIPAALWLFGSGIIGLIGIAKRKKS